MYRKLIVPVFIALVAAMPAAADTSQNDKQEIVRVIGAQMDAFIRDDGTEAFSYAAPSIRAMFQTPERFMSMVQRGYPPVYRPVDVRFLDLVDSGARPLQKVQIVGQDGRPVMAVYTMEQQPDGSWRIAGCVLFQIDGRST